MHLPKALAKLWFTTFVKTAPCQTWKSLTKLRSQYCLDIASKHWKDLLQTQLQCNIFSSCNPLPFNNCELSLPLRLPDYVSHSLVKMLSQTKLIVLPLQTKTSRHPNKNQCKIIWLSLFAKQKPFCDYFLWLFSVIIFRDHFFPPTPTSISLQNYLTSLFDKQKPVHDYFLLSLQQLVRLLQMCKKLQLFIFWQLTHCHIIFPHAAKYHYVIIYAYSNCIKISSLLFTTVSCVGH